jgi:hypothetical protein
MDIKDAQEMVKNGILPKLKESFIHSDHPIDRVLVKAMDMCFEYNWRQRARANQVRNLLVDAMENIIKKSVQHQHTNHELDDFVLHNQRHNRRR